MTTKTKPGLYKQPSRYMTTRKVAYGTGGGGATVILLWVLSMFGIELPADVAAQLGAALATLVGLIASYFTHERLPPTNVEIVK